MQKEMPSREGRTGGEGTGELKPCGGLVEEITMVSAHPGREMGKAQGGSARPAWVVVCPETTTS